MKRPSDIPGDIWATASERAWQQMGTQQSGDVEVIARAIKAERDRCVSVVFGAYCHTTAIGSRIVLGIRQGDGT